MKAAYYEIILNRAGAYGETLTFVQTGTSDPIDLTGLAPFKAEVRDRSSGPLLLALTVTGTDLENGQISISASAEDTANLTPHVSKWGLIDSEGTLYLYGAANILPMIPEL